MSKPKLTISIPTYNRSDFIVPLLKFISREAAPYASDVEIIVSDNCSTDGTREALEASGLLVDGVKLISNPENVGGDRNILLSFERASGRYVWVLGDDDVPVPGAVARVLEAIDTIDPDLIHLPSSWCADARYGDAGPRTIGQARVLDAEGFMRTTSYWVTFISGLVVKKELFDTLDIEAGSLLGTNFSQLNWVLNVLKHGKTFVAFDAPCILATGGNTGGYAVLTTFGVNLPEVTALTLGRNSKLNRILSRRTLVGFLPNLIWDVRFGDCSRFSTEAPWPALRRAHGGEPLFWLLVAPVLLLPKPLARVPFLAARALAKAMKILDAAAPRGSELPSV